MRSIRPLVTLAAALTLGACLPVEPEPFTREDIEAMHPPTLGRAGPAFGDTLYHPLRRAGGGTAPVAAPSPLPEELEEWEEESWYP